MANLNRETCSVCGVKIVGEDTVIFSSGPVGTRGRLWARVCSYAKKTGCINQDHQAIGEVHENDYYNPLK
ncbi:hypothetical protein [Crocosphaera sp. Alani8]|uniref:hypothetical protein n=1 Tax=Crocosphaera sp. Alani8 TaxID=3038952 RepID=UPI00313E6C42